MKILFVVGFFALGFLAFAQFAASSTVYHEIAATLMGIAALLSLIAAAVLSELSAIRRHLEDPKGRGEKVLQYLDVLHRRAKMADRNAWSVNSAILDELKNPGNVSPPPEFLESDLPPKP